MRVLAGIALLVSMLPAMAGAGLVVFDQNFSSSTNVADYYTPAGGTNKFNAITAGPTDGWSITTGGALQFTRTSTNSSGILQRSTALAAAPLTNFVIQFDIGFAFTNQAANSSTIFLEIGPASGYWGTIGFMTDSTGSNNVWRIGDGLGGFTGVKTVKMYVNDTGSNSWYMDPLGAKRTITNSFVDVWVGNTLARSKVAQNQNLTKDINEFRFVSPVKAATSETITFDNFNIEQIPEPATIGLISFATAGLLLFRRFHLMK